MKPYPPVLNEIAEIIGRRRDYLGRKRNEATGDLRSWTGKGNVDGALAELIVLNEMSQIEEAYWKQHKIFDDGYITAPDFSINGKAYDVKSVTRDELRVNCRKHDSKKFDCYLFVKANTRIYQYTKWTAKREEVETWEINPMTGVAKCDPFRFKKI